MKTNRYIISKYEVSEIEEAYSNDQADTPAAEIEKMILEAAIEIARERARMYFMPATWTATRNKDNTITVTRTHN